MLRHCQHCRYLFLLKSSAIARVRGRCTDHPISSSLVRDIVLSDNIQVGGKRLTNLHMKADRGQKPIGRNYKASF